MLRVLLSLLAERRVQRRRLRLKLARGRQVLRLRLGHLQRVLRMRVHQVRVGVVRVRLPADERARVADGDVRARGRRGRGRRSDVGVVRAARRELLLMVRGGGELTSGRVRARVSGGRAVRDCGRRRRHRRVLMVMLMLML